MDYIAIREQLKLLDLHIELNLMRKTEFHIFESSFLKTSIVTIIVKQKNSKMLGKQKQNVH